MKLSRRRLAGAVLGSAAAFAQPPQPPIPRNADEELAAAREQMRRTSEALHKQPVPMSTEPAFLFKA